MKGLRVLFRFLPGTGACLAISAVLLLFPAGCFNDDSQHCGCKSGSVKNSFANGKYACCPSGYPYYCNGNGMCYQTWSDAYYNNSAGCTLPQDRVTCP